MATTAEQTERQIAWQEKAAGQKAWRAERAAAMKAVRGIQLGLIIECVATGRLRFVWTETFPLNVVIGKSYDAPGIIRVVAAFPAKRSDVEALRLAWKVKPDPTKLVTAKPTGWIIATDEMRAAVLAVGYVGPLGLQLKRFLGMAARRGQPLMMTTNERVMANYAWRGIPKGPALAVPDYSGAVDAAQRYNRRYAVYGNTADPATCSP
jgi:hypothetical protein